MEKISKSTKGLKKLMDVENDSLNDSTFLLIEDILVGLLRVMVRKKVSKAELAKRMGISRQAVSEKFGGLNTSIVWIHKACDALDVKMNVSFVDKI